MSKMKKTYLLLWLAACYMPVLAQHVDWNRVERMTEDKLSKVYSRDRISASWIDGSTCLTYNERVNGRMQYYLVNADGKKQPLFKDNDKFVEQYTKLTGDTTMTADEIKLYGVSMRNNNPNRLYWVRRGKHLVYDRKTGKLALDQSYKKKSFSTRNSGLGRSPHTDDSLYTMLGDRYNLYIKDNRSGDTTQITFDGKENASYCYGSSKAEIRESNASGSWRGHVYINFIHDDSEVGNLYIIDAISGHRPKLRTKKMPLPNEKGVRQFKLFWYNADTHEGRLLPVQGTMTDPTIALAYNNSQDTLWFTRRSRGVDTLQLCRIDLPTGNITEVITEVSKPHINLTFSGYRFIRGDQEILWWSERTGRGNYYLYDIDGNLKCRVTHGDKLVAGRIEQINEKAGYMIFCGYGQEPASDPGYTFYYKVDLKGRRQQLLTPGNGTHELNFADDHRYAIDTYSRMDMPPIYQIIDIKHPGKVREFARTSDRSLRAMGWQPPTIVKVKAADNTTDLYGVMYLPTNFDKNKKYPIISNVYPGPQDDQLPRRFTLDDNGNQALAEMGFVVINVAPRGSGPLRGHDFYCFSHGNLRDYPLADDKHTIETLAARYNFIDLDRVGIYGHSGGGFMTATAMMTYPDFYKVGVAASGNYDNNNYIQWWGETFHGLVPQDSIPTTMQLADNLKGKLLLISGDVDDNVPWANTLRLADALIKHNKRFDMMVLPGKDHGVWSPYYLNLIRYYFMEHLMKPSERDVDIIKHTK
ncbi:MAG: prolyl oligopeptidase family serine peptidase [Prevotella sp.]|jgi:dipeptidyl-peptidase-4